MTFAVQLRDAWCLYHELLGWGYKNPFGGRVSYYPTELEAAVSMAREREWLGRNPIVAPGGLYR